MGNNNNPTVCALCNNPPEIPCPTCRELQVLYCSSECLTRDVPIHKLVCASFTNPPVKPAGPSKHVLGLHFPASAPTPELVWVRIGGFTDEDSGISFQEAEVGDFLGDDAAGGKAPESLHSERNRLRNRDTRSMLEVWHVRSDALQENACIRALAATAGNGDGEGAPFYRWTGAVLVLFMTRSTGFMVDPGAYRDCQLQDYRDAVDFVVDYGNDVHDKRVQEALDTLGSQVREEDDKAEGGSKNEASVVDQAEQDEPPKEIVAEMSG